MMVPSAWQYPEVRPVGSVAEIMEFKTDGFVITPWCQRSEFSAGNLKGEIEVVYLEQRPLK
jgi:hypothetical protein